MSTATTGCKRDVDLNHRGSGGSSLVVNRRNFGKEN
ncbi:hypothetical protein BIW11_02726 [Tropilaelaps mercedesae]|uniref:Uncharacterized protein n=1 Tax=Tropilaelaps mercedesae TaxID=418985 RepID=A0A1V9XY99_9ACAR|nr:hypothetical protein BIW11_02726 [Tropilaelaps mercedesae]